ncbi:MAG: transcription elongation factor GreA [Anaerolineae bacterium]
MDAEVIYLTREGYRENEANLNYLINVRRSEVAARLRQALEEGGELVENAEYADAKHEQAMLEGEIERLKDLLSRARIIEDEVSAGPPDVVRLNSVVTVQEDGGEPMTFHIVGPVEANPREGKISDASPLGKALLGKKVGDIVVFEAPDGAFRYRILSVKQA